MDSVTQGNGGPVAVLGGRPDGPYWSAFGPSEAALQSINYAGQLRGDANFQTHFVRDAISREVGLESLRGEIKNAVSNLQASQAGLERSMAAQEVARLRESIDASRHGDLLAAISKLTEVVAGAITPPKS